MEPKKLVFKPKCRHFNGVQHDACDAGVRYESVRDPEGRPYAALPCLDVGHGSASASRCLHISLLTQDEHAARHQKLEAEVNRVLSDLRAGKCFVCGAPIEPSKIVGRCKYAACGHRIGQVSTSDDDE